MYYIGIKQRIIEELQDMGFNFRQIGTTYMVEVIEILYNAQNANMLRNIEKSVYVKLSEKYDKNINTIKSNIVKATDTMYSQYVLQQKRSNPNCKIYQKITPKMVINEILLKLSV